MKIVLIASILIVLALASCNQSTTYKNVHLACYSTSSGEKITKRTLLNGVIIISKSINRSTYEVCDSNTGEVLEISEGVKKKNRLNNTIYYYQVIKGTFFGGNGITHVISPHDISTLIPGESNKVYSLSIYTEDWAGILDFNR